MNEEKNNFFILIQFQTKNKESRLVVFSVAELTKSIFKIVILILQRLYFQNISNKCNKRMPNMQHSHLF